MGIPGEAVGAVESVERPFIIVQKDFGVLPSGTATLVRRGRISTLVPWLLIEWAALCQLCTQTGKDYLMDRGIAAGCGCKHSFIPLEGF